MVNNAGQYFNGLRFMRGETIYRCQFRQLTKMGSQGWELCGVVTRHGFVDVNVEKKPIALIYHYFKRPANKIITSIPRLN